MGEEDLQEECLQEEDHLEEEVYLEGRQLLISSKPIAVCVFVNTLEEYAPFTDS